MDIGEEVVRARMLPDDALLASLVGILGSGRRLTALLVAHLGEVEERRLHLLAGYGSMFEYCTTRLGMSEDEACRRIEVARLARRFPLLYERLASGGVSLSVVALLRHSLTDANHAGLLDAVSGKTVARARVVLAAWFPQPDVPPTIRKLPERRPAIAATDERRSESASARLESSGAGGFGTGSVKPEAVSAVDARDATASLSDAISQTTLRDARPPVAEKAAPGTSAPPVLPPPPSRAIRGSFNVAPLSPGRFKVSFTADAELKQKLDLARDLLRHAVPSGDLATIVGRALDLLIEKTEKRRFARTTRKPTTTSASTEAAGSTDERTVPPPAVSRAPVRGDLTGPPSAPPVPPVRATAPAKESEQKPTPPAASATPPSAPLPSRYLPAAVRRAVHDRDGMRCTWQAPDGTRCNSRAWLEHDHIIPRGQGGANDPANIRPYCRAHNRLAAERAYGRATITRIIARRRATRTPRDSADNAHDRQPLRMTPRAPG